MQDLLDRHSKKLLGEKTSKKFGYSQLPLLAKVLSIAKAFPLQLHPDKERATKLHLQNPDAFTDPNPQPEIALALGKFEAFCGFKPLPEIYELLRMEALQHFTSTKQLSNFTNERLKVVMRKMLEASDETVRQTYEVRTSA